VLKLDGYDDTDFKIRPNDAGSIALKMVKSKPGVRPPGVKTIKPPPDATGSGKRPAGNGELGGFPAGATK
jgi:hypothetical protein